MPDAMDGEETSFLPLALEIDGEAANLSDELLFIPAPDDCWADDADTVVAVLKEAIDDVGVIGDGRDFSAGVPLGDLIARSCNSWIL